MIKQASIALPGVCVNTAAQLIQALGGNAETGMCLCPAHDDRVPSLHVEDVSGKVLFCCHAGCSQTTVLDALRARGCWSSAKRSSQSAPPTRGGRSIEQRRAFALQILASTQTNRGVELAGELSDYFQNRGIQNVPPTAMLALPCNLTPDNRRLLLPDVEPAMVFAVCIGSDVVGCHVTWLTPDLSAKSDEEPRRQFYGPVGGGYIRLYSEELCAPAKLIISEGVETALSASQMTGGLPAIAALSSSNMPKINPPDAGEYIIAADNDSAGLKGAQALASKLTREGAVVRIATPSSAGADWNDILMMEAL